MTTNITSAQLEAAADALDDVLRFEHPADGVLSGYFRTNKQVGARDRAFVADAVYGVLRNLRQLRAVAGEEARPRKLLLSWLTRCEGYSQRQLLAFLSKGEIDWIADIKAKAYTPETVGERTNMPNWLAERLAAQYGEEKLMAMGLGVQSSCHAGYSRQSDENGS